MTGGTCTLAEMPQNPGLSCIGIRQRGVGSDPFGFKVYRAVQANVVSFEAYPEQAYPAPSVARSLREGFRIPYHCTTVVTRRTVLHRLPIAVVGHFQ